MHASNNMPSWCTQLTVQPARRHLWVLGVEPPAPSEKVTDVIRSSCPGCWDQATCPETKGRRLVCCAAARLRPLEDATRGFFLMETLIAKDVTTQIDP